MACQVKLNVISKSLHTHGVVAGFLMLEDQGLIDLQINLCFDKAEKYPTEHMVEAVVEGKVLAFDMLDGYNWDLGRVKDYLKTCDRYFKRSYSAGKNRALTEQEAAKLSPLGCSYHVVHPRADFLEERDVKTRLKNIYHRLRGQQNQGYFTPDRFETIPEYKEKDLKILFFTRLWEQQDCPSVPEEELAYINQMRIDIIRGLLETYPSQARAGVSSTPLAQRLCPDLILPRRDTVRNHYLDIMKAADICIGSMGLHESVGWKTGEYIAGAKAIVNETLHYEMTGDFAAGTHYLPFTDAASCLACVDSLMNDPQRVFEMKQHCRAYYERFLRPDRQVLVAIETALKGSTP